MTVYGSGVQVFNIDQYKTDHGDLDEVNLDEENLDEAADKDAKADEGPVYIGQVGEDSKLHGNFCCCLRRPWNLLTGAVFTGGGLAMLIGGALTYVECDEHDGCFDTSKREGENIGIGLMCTGGTLMLAGAGVLCKR